MYNLSLGSCIILIPFNIEKQIKSQLCCIVLNEIRLILNLVSKLFPTGKKNSISEPHTHSGYSNNFGQPIGGSPTVEAQMIVSILQSIVLKFVDNAKEINNQENIVSD